MQEKTPLETRKITHFLKVTIGLMFGSLVFAVAGIYILFAPRWSQLGYVNINWSNFETIYQYPKTEPYLMDLLLPIIISLLVTTLLLFIYITKNILTKRSNHWIVKLFGGLFLIGMFATGSVTTVIGAPDLEFMYYDSEPYITWAPDQATNTSITVCWHSAWPTNSQLKYGIARNNLNKTATSDQFSRFHQVKIDGLLANTTYYYRVEGLKLDFQSYRVREFTTCANGAFNYTFAVWSDPRTNNPLSSALEGANLPQYMSEQITEQDLKLAFSLCVGDITARGVDYQTWKLWQQDITTNDFASNASNMIAIGNHERHDDGYRLNFPNYYPVRESDPLIGLNFTDTSYSYDYGNVHFTLLDRWDYENPWWSSDDMAQAVWLEQDLIAHSEAKFKILAIHPNPVLGDEHSGDCTNIMNIARAYGVDVIFCGHWHMYETRDLNGDLIVSTGSMNSIDNITMTIGLGGSYSGTDYAAYCQVDVTEDTLTLRPRYIDGEWMEAWKIEKA
jgi:hypothetical protein